MYAIGIPTSFFAGFICKEMLKKKNTIVGEDE